MPAALTAASDWSVVSEIRVDSVVNTYGENISRISSSVDKINKVIALQKNYVDEGYFQERVDITVVVNDVLNLYEKQIKELGTQVIKNYDFVSDISIQKPKLVFILTHVIENALEAMVPDSKSRLSITIAENSGKVVVEINDNGIGIHPDNMINIFRHGFSTQDNKSGFGLHSCANYMSEMDGKLKVESEGEQKGATFILEFPAFAFKSN